MLFEYASCNGRVRRECSCVGGKGLFSPEPPFISSLFHRKQRVKKGIADSGAVSAGKVAAYRSNAMSQWFSASGTKQGCTHGLCRLANYSACKHGVRTLPRNQLPACRRLRAEQIESGAGADALDQPTQGIGSDYTVGYCAGNAFVPKGQVAAHAQKQVPMRSPPVVASIPRCRGAGKRRRIFKAPGIEQTQTVLKGFRDNPQMQMRFDRRN
jgi:hypothetical protein